MQRIHDNFAISLFYFIEIVYCYSDIFGVLYLGNEIMLASDRLSYCLFESDWIIQTEQCKEHMIILVEYLKRPRRFVVGKLFSVDLEMFTTVSITLNV